MIRFELTVLLVLSFSGLTGIALAGEDEFHIRSHRAIYTPAQGSPRARGMGGSFAALSNGASGIYENPAGLGAQTDREAFLDLGFEGIDDNGQEATWVTINAGGAVNINVCAPHYWPREEFGNRTVGFAIRSYGVGFDSRDGLESDLNGFVLAYGQSFVGGRFFGGASFGFDTGDMEDDDRTIDNYVDRFELKLGMIYRPSDRMALGSMMILAKGTLQQEGSLYRDDGDLSDVTFRWGAAYQVTSQTLLVGDVMTRTLEIDTDDQVEEHHIWKLSGGLEQMLIENTLAVRGGMYYLRDSYTCRNMPFDNMVDDYGAFTAGASFFKDSFELSYNLELKTTGETGHFIRIEYDW